LAGIAVAPTPAGFVFHLDIAETHLTALHGRASVRPYHANPPEYDEILDDDGYFFIVDRKKEMIIRGGFNIYPREIEEVLHEHPDVMKVAVVGLPHDELGEEVGAAVVLQPGSQADAEDVKRFVKRGSRRTRTSTRVTCGSTTRFPRDPPARSCGARSSPHPGRARRWRGSPCQARGGTASSAADSAAGPSSPR
jgi:AMP-binding enzyme C-terminal domain